MPETKEYRAKVYKALKSELGDVFDKSEEQFNNALDTEQDYSSKVYKALSGELGDSFSKTEDEFTSLMAVKKKEPSEDGLQDSQEPVSQPTTPSPRATERAERAEERVESPAEETFADYKASIADTTSIPSKYLATGTKAQATEEEQLTEADEIGILEDKWNRLKSAGTKAVGNILGMEAAVNEAAFLITANVTGNSEFVDILNEMKPEVRREVIATLSPGIAGTGSTKTSLEAQEALNKIGEGYDEHTRQYEGNIVDAAAEGKLGEVADRVFGGVVESIPYLAIGAVNLPMIGVSAGVGKLREEEMEGEKLSSGLLLTSTISGASEAFFEKYTQGILSRSFKPFKKLAKGNAKAAKEVAESIYKRVLKDMGIEIASEDATSLIQDLADKLILGKDISIFQMIKNMGDATMVAGVMSGAISTPGAIASKLSESLAKKNLSDKGKIVDNDSKIAGIEGEKTVENADTNEEVQEELVDENKELLKEGGKLFNKMSEEDQTAVKKLSAKLNHEELQLQKEGLGEETINAIEGNIQKIEGEIQDVKNKYEAEEAVEEPTKEPTPKEEAKKPSPKAVEGEEVSVGETVELEVEPKKEAPTEAPTPETKPTEKVEEAKEEAAPTEAETKKAELEEKITTGKKEQSDYIKRRLKDLRDTKEFRKSIEELGGREVHNIKLADKESHTLVKELKEAYGEKEGLDEGLRLLKTGAIPELMIGPMGAKLDLKMRAAGMHDKAREVVDIMAKAGTAGGRTLVGLRSDASPDATVSRLFAGLEKGKSKALSKEYEPGKTYKDALEEMRNQLEATEKAFEEAKKSGKIKEENLPDPSKLVKSKEIKLRAKKMRRDGISSLKAALRKQRGQAQMGAPIDPDMLKAMGQILQSYVLEFGGNVRSAYEKFKGDVSKEFDISEKDIESFKKDLISQSDEIIEEFKQQKKRQIIEDILKPKGKETKAEREARRDTVEAMLSDFAEGKSDEAISDNLADVAGFEQLSPQDTKEILDLTEKYSQLSSDGKAELAYETWEDLMLKLGDLNLQKRESHEVLLDVWYTAVLSGLTTIARSIKGSGMTTAMFMSTRLLANPKAAPFMISQMVKGAKGTLKNYAHVLKTGKSQVNVTDFEPKLPKYTDVIFKKSFKELNTKGKIAKAVMALPTIMYRNIVAFDQVLKNSVSEGNVALFEMQKTAGKGKKIAERVEIAKKALAEGRNEEIRTLVDNEIADLTEEGEKVPYGYKDRRFREIKDELRDQDVVKRALEDAANAALVGTPKGVLGWAYNTWINAIEIQKKDAAITKGVKLLFKSIFPFIRVSFNWINAGLDYTPIGAARALRGETWTREGYRKWESYEKRELYGRAALGLSVGATFLAGMFDWDEDEGLKLKDKDDRWIEVYGPLTGKWWETEDVAPDAKPWSIRFKNPFTGEWSGTYKYLDNPIGFMFAPIGTMADEIRFEDFKKEARGKGEEIRHPDKKSSYFMGTWVTSTIRYAMEQSFNQGMNTVAKLMNPVDEESYDKHLTDLFVRPSEGLYPAIYKQMHNQVKGAFGISERERRKWYDRPARLFPFADAIIKNEKLDVFGYPIVRDFDFPFVPDLILKAAKENLDYREEYKEWQLLHKYEEVTVGGFLAPKTHKGYKLTDDDKDQFMLDAGMNMRERVNGNYDALNSMTAEKLQARLSSYKSKSLSFANKRINK